MNCYLCSLQRENAPHPALGICHTCGAGICEQHLVQVVSRPVVGMASSSHTRRHLLCSQCMKDVNTPLRPAALPREAHECSRAPRPFWKRWLRPRTSSALPQPEEAVAFVERFFQHPQHGQKETEP